MTDVSPSAESVEPLTTVQWAHVLDDQGSADLYDTEEEARSMLALMGGGVDRIESTTVVPLSVTPPGRGTQ